MTHGLHQDNPLPYAQRRAEDAPGHWLLARLGKRVLRPGGLELTRKLLKNANLTDADVVELAPGLGRTATELLSFQPASYVVGLPANRGHVVVGLPANRGHVVELPSG